MFNLNYNLIRFLEIKEAKNIRMPSVEILMILAKQKKCGATEGNEAPKRRRSLRRANERSKKRGRPGVAPPRCAHPFAIDLSAFRLFFFGGPPSAFPFSFLYIWVSADHTWTSDVRADYANRFWPDFSWQSAVDASRKSGGRISARPTTREGNDLDAITMTARKNDLETERERERDTRPTFTGTPPRNPFRNGRDQGEAPRMNPIISPPIARFRTRFVDNNKKNGKRLSKKRVPHGAAPFVNISIISNEHKSTIPLLRCIFYEPMRLHSSRLRLHRQILVWRVFTVKWGALFFKVKFDLECSSSNLSDV